jgi:uncharacterized protein
MIVDDTINEREKVWGTFIASVFDDSTFKLTVNPTLSCNFRCWYCYENHEAKPRMTPDVFDKLKKAIAIIATKYQCLELSFFGGEPMLEFNTLVHPLIDYVHHIASETGLKYEVTFTTNGFLINDEIIEKLHPYNIGLSQITLDGGPDHHNKTRISHKQDSFLTIVSNIKRLVNAKMPVLIRINVTGENIEDAFKIISFFENVSSEDKKYLYLIVQQVWQDKTDIYDKIWELYEAFSEVGIKPFKKNPDLISHICYGDKCHSAVVNHDGMVYKCTAMDFDGTNAEGKLDSEGKIISTTSIKAHLEKRRNNTKCNDCRILPLCNGGCFKHVVNSEKSDYCIYPTEEDKNTVVKRTISEQIFMSQWYPQE